MDLKKAQTMMLDMMKYHNLVGWSFRFDRAVNRLGLCQHSRKIISLGRHATEVNSEDQVRLTIIHEIAHALVGGQHGHDAVWRAKAIELGHSGERCGNIAVKATPKAIVMCHNCLYTWNLYRVSKMYLYNLNRMWCRTCGKEKSQGQLVLEKVK